MYVPYDIPMCMPAIYRFVNNPSLTTDTYIFAGACNRFKYIYTHGFRVSQMWGS